MFTTHTHRHTRSGFSLIELVIVLVIIGVIGAIAIPKFSHGAEGAAASALAHDLAVVNKALEMYAAEHNGQYPGEAEVGRQLTQQTYADGSVPDDPPTQTVFGPYLRDAPPAPVGPRKGQKGVSTIDGPAVGWIYQRGNSRITVNLGGQNAEDVLSGKQLEVLKDFLGL